MKRDINDYMGRLRETYPDFTESELRHVCRLFTENLTVFLGNSWPVHFRDGKGPGVFRFSHEDLDPEEQQYWGGMMRRESYDFARFWEKMRKMRKVKLPKRYPTKR